MKFGDCKIKKYDPGYNTGTSIIYKTSMAITLTIKLDTSGAAAGVVVQIVYIFNAGNGVEFGWFFDRLHIPIQLLQNSVCFQLQTNIWSTQLDTKCPQVFHYL